MKVHVWIGMVVSLLFVALILWKVDLNQIGSTLLMVRYVYFAPLLVAILLTLLIRAFRWRYLLEPVKPIGLHPLFSATAIGFMANMLLPARLGELVRAYAVSHKEGISKSASLATIVVERLFDGFSILLMLVLVLLFVVFPPQMQFVNTQLKLGGLLSLLFYMGVMLLLFLVHGRRPQVLRFLQRVVSLFSTRVASQICASLEAFVSGLRGIQHVRCLVLIALSSLLLWTVYAVFNQLVLLAFGLRLPFYAALFLVIFQAFGVMLPSSPGYIGTFHVASMAALAFFGVSGELALSIAIFMHAITFVPIVALGLVYLWVENLSFGELWRVGGGTASAGRGGN